MGSNQFSRKYLPMTMSKRDITKQRIALLKTRKAYPKGKYVNRPQLGSFVSRDSPHVERAKKMYGVDNIRPTHELAKASGCSISALRKITRKGEGAYYSSGSRPNQTAQSWAYARLGSSLTGGPASRVDYDILRRGCSRKSRALRMASRA
jgi:hypothetical protein